MSLYGRDYGHTDYGSTEWGSRDMAVDVAELRPRGLAFLIDALVLFVPATVAAIVGYYAIYRPACDSFQFLGATRYDCSSAGAAGVGWWAVVVVVLVAVAVGYEIVPTGRTGQTWAKRRFGVRVVGTSTGRPIGVGPAAVRFMIKWFVSLLWLGAGFWWAMGDPARRTWHDRICDTAVTPAPVPGSPATG